MVHQDPIDPQRDFPVNQGQYRGNWIRLRTLILLRWFAIIGQLSALVVAAQVYGLQLSYAPCLFVVGLSVIANLIASFLFPETKRLNEVENLAMVLFDLLQLGALLYLTGGLHNPFSILIVGPATVSALALSSRMTLFVGSTAIVLVTLLAEFHLPLRTAEGQLLEVAQVFLFGNWLAIVIAVIFLGIYSRWIVNEMHSMSDALQATQMALAREQRLSDLGGVVAAAAHELGTPLATIKLTSSELVDELEDRPELAEDARLIREQADRCRDILRSMGRAGKDDLHLHQAPLSAVLEEAAEPHGQRGVALQFQHGDGSSPPPSILRRPELIHGLRNLVQNAVDFARSEVRVESRWDDDRIIVRIMDDGRGFSAADLGRIGDPFMHRRWSFSEGSERPGYEGMGLGLFIAKTLLERSGAELIFANGNDFDGAEGWSGHPGVTGAIVEVTWPRSVIDARTGRHAIAPGRNQPFN
ncbi:MAG: ActS/PrrB/RegB family redox-sensitive histidine kinase [Rhodobacteraceae bacterium]|nr:ActS/PrrB/RegB family redox-sensitive histidine kinase [Paracoccaceae bacterium]MBR9821251.1 ActS/PrrB/RegB family redox-sensitive histidine kinase [Paracoccaceae bacterium]